MVWGFRVSGWVPLWDLGFAALELVGFGIFGRLMQYSWGLGYGGLGFLL